MAKTKSSRTPNKNFEIVAENLLKDGVIKNKTEMATIMKTQLNVVNDMLNGARPVTDTYLNRLKAAFPNLNVEYIKTGKGDWKNGEFGKEEKKLVSVSQDLLNQKIEFLERELRDKEKIISLLEKLTK